MLTSRGLLCAMASAFLFVGPVNAALILFDNFDGYANQAAFDAAWPIIGTASDVLNTEQASSPTQSAKGLTTATRSGRSVGEIGLMNGTSDVVAFKVDFYDSSGAAAAYRQYAELIDGAGTS